MHGVLSEEACRDLSVCWDMLRKEAVTRGNGWWEGGVLCVWVMKEVSFMGVTSVQL